MNRSLSRKRSEENLISNPRAKVKTSSMSNLPKLSEPLSLSFFRHQKPENQNLAESFSNQYIVEDPIPDQTVYKFLPQLKKKNLPSTFLSVKHAHDMTAKLAPKPKKKVIRTTNKLERLRENKESFEIDLGEELEQIEKVKSLTQVQSLPLSMYDPVLDPQSPRSMIEANRSSDLSTYAYSKWFLPDGTCFWKKCKVEKWDEQHEKFLIHWPEGGKKYASRINLRFEEEDPEKFERRISEAKKYKTSIENTYHYNIFVSNFIKLDPPVSTTVISKVLLFLQGKNKLNLEKYRKVIEFYQQDVKDLHNPSKYLWPNEISHFKSEICLIKGAENYSEIIEKLIKDQEPINLFLYSGDRQVPFEKITSLVNEYKDNWKLECKHIEYKMRKNKFSSIKLNQEPSKVYETHKNIEKFIENLKQVNENHVHNDQTRIIVSQKLNEIILTWTDLTMAPKYKKSIYLEEFKSINEKTFDYFMKEIQNAVFDIQYEIQSFLSEEDQKRIEKNKLKLKSKAYSKQFVELEENLPEHLLDLYKKFVFMCNLKFENSIRKIVYNSLQDLNQVLLKPIEVICWKLNSGIPLKKDDFELSGFAELGIFRIDLGIDSSNKSFKLSPPGAQYCLAFARFIENCFKKLGNLPCLGTTQTGTAREPAYMKISSDFPKKTSKILELIKENLNLEQQLLSNFMTSLEKFNFILQIKPSDISKKFEGVLNIDKVEDEIFRLQRIKIDLHELIGKNGRSLGIWKVFSSHTLTVVMDIIDKGIDEMVKLLLAESLKNVQEVEGVYAETVKVVKHIPKDLEELEQIRTFIFNEFSLRTEFIDQGVSRIMSIIEILEGYWRLIPFDVYERCWNCLSFSTNLQTFKQTCLKTLETLISTFTSSLHTQKSVLFQEIQGMSSDLQLLKQQDNYDEYEKFALECQKLQVNLNQATETMKVVNTREQITSQQQTDFTQLNEIKNEFSPYCKIWFYIRDFEDRLPKWYDDRIFTLHRDAIGTEIITCVNELGKLERTILKNDPAALKLIKHLLAKLNQFRPYLPIIKCVNNPGMKERHWIEFRNQTGIDLVKVTHVTLRDLIGIKILSFLEQLEAVSDLATKEMGLENAKKKMENEWISIKFQLSPYKNSFVLVNTDIIWETLNEHLMRTIAMSASPYIQFIMNEILIWKANLLRIQEVLEEWEKFQKNWQYLQPIFTNNDISKQLPQPANKFRTINVLWDTIMHNVQLNPNVYEYCTNSPKIYDNLLNGNESLDSILKSLNEYLMCKRKIFPRFYFLSNEELIMILSNSQNIITIQKYIIKCFEAISSVQVENGFISGMISPEGEMVKFENLVELYLEGEIKSIEIWMVDLEKEMRNSLNLQMQSTLCDFSNDVRTWVNNWPSQLIQASLMTIWTQNVENSIKENTLSQLSKDEETFLTVLVNAVRGELSPLERLTFSTMVVLDVHNKDVIFNLIDKNVETLADFSWFCHMRYYMSRGSMIVKMLDCTRTYGYEYLGNTSRLVVTELTDRCYRTLMSALKLNLGGAPEGPAGTGKTETAKDLAKCLAKKCVVFNCSDRLDHIYMAKFFTGLCYCGAWACFDEFNRIELEVLSVIAEQIMSIQSAVQRQARFFYMEEDYTQLDPTCAIFITMNPDYAGRTKLPDNLKALFRPVAMMIPDYAMIAEIYLYSFGFREARKLSHKITNSLRLASEQLSTQTHYDYGMRAISTVIKAAGWLKQRNPKTSEDLIVLNAIKASNIPKFINQDLPLFDGILKDLFPEVSEEREKDDIEEMISNAIIDCKLVENFKFFEKVLQIYSTILIRHGLMIIGQSMAGKTTALEVLAKALGYRQMTMTCHINPKSITLNELYGAPDPISLDWKDGILAQFIRSFSDFNSPGYKWIILDGPVDALWIESINTVMDDNKKLCLPNGEIIKLTELIRIIVEVDNLVNASPATISRCGMIFIDSEDVLGPQVLISQWCSYPPFDYLAPRFKKLFQNLFSSYFIPSLDFWSQNLNQIKHISKSHLTKNMISLFESLIIKKGKSRKQHDKDITEENVSRNSIKPEVNEDSHEGGKLSVIERIVSKNALQTEIKAITNPEETEKEKEKLVNLFIFAAYWTIAGCTRDTEKKKLAEYLKSLLKNNENIPEDLDEVYYSDSTYEWKYFKDLIFEPVRDAEVSNVFVPTISLISYKFIINELITRKISIVVNGETGTGKTVLIKHILCELDKSFQVAYTMFTGSTGSGDIQNFIEKNLSRIRKGFLGLEVNKFRVFMIDDLNMPGKEQFGAQPALELLRTAIDRSELYDRGTLELKTLENVQYVGAMGAKGASSGVSPRFLSHFFITTFAQYTHSSLFIILSTMFTIGLENHSNELRCCADLLSTATIHLYHKTLSTLPPTPLKNHYVFNFRDLTNVLKGILSVPSAKLPDSLTLFKLWTHESLRVFSDRLINDEDQIKFKANLHEILQNDYNVDLKHFETEPIFLSYLYENTYQMVPSMNRAKKVLRENLEDYNQDNPESKLNLIFFDYAVKHINRISRVLSWNNGNLLLIGVGGSSGRSSLTKLSAYMQKLSFFQIRLTKTYNLNEWTEDIKQVLNITGFENKKLVFLIKNNEVIQEAFLEVINSILATGYYHDIFSPEEISGINESMKMNRKYYSMTNAERWEVFLSNIRRNLHIVICMYPQGDTLRTRIREFPALVNCCTIDWFFDWPRDALEAVARYFFSSESIISDKGKRPSAIKICVNFHESVKILAEKYFAEYKRMYFVTPAHYIQLLKTMKKLYKMKEETTIKQSHKYSVGINKLNQTQALVQELRNELLELKPVLQQKTQIAHEILKSIQKENLEADSKREFVKNEQEASQVQTLIAEQIKKECQDALNKALPELEAAIKALDTIKRDDIDQVKSMREPPDTIKVVLEALAIIHKLKPVRIKDPKNPNIGQPDFYEAGKKFLSVPKFIQKLKSFDRSSLEEEIIHKITPYIEMSKFHPDIVKNASRAAEGLCKWVRAMYNYYFVNKEVQPKQASLKIAELDLAEKSRLLKIKQDELVKIEEIIAEMQNKLNLQIAETKALSDDIAKVELHLDRAVKLIDQLGGERESWTIKVKQYEKDMENLLGDVLLSAACITYFGPFFGNYREKCVQEMWIPFITQDGEILCNSLFSFSGCVAEPITIQKWNLNGLPNDKVSIENAAIIQLSIMYPLIIDPQRQAIKWLNKMLSQAKSSFYKTRFDSNEFNYTLDNSLLLGSSLIIEEVKGTLDPLLDPLLLKQFFFHEGIKVVKIGDISRPVDDKFYLYMFTPYSNPVFSPELFTKTTILNFSITEEALSEQLLNLICRFEIPRETEERNRLVVQSVEYIRNMLALEEKILELLQLGGENILESEELINSLTESKVVSIEVEKKLANSKHAEQKIANFQGIYKPVSKLSAVLYFCIADLANLDCMYQYSMIWFMNVFKKALIEAEKSKDINERLKNVKFKFRELIFEGIFHSLQDKDRILFAFLICVRVMMFEKDMQPWQWRFYLTGVCGVTEEVRNVTEFLNDKMWREICQLDIQVQGLRDHVVRNQEVWKGFINTDKQWVQVPSFEEFSSIIPQAFIQTTPITRLLIFRALKPESLGVAVKSFIKSYLGEFFIVPKVLKIESIIEESSPLKPLILVLTAGNDPQSMIKRYAAENNWELKTASLGKGQGEKAEKIIKEAIQSGFWVLVQNCHLALSWMPTVENIIEDLSLKPSDSYNKDFRLILTSSPAEGFPSLLLQKSIKLIAQPPGGLCSSLLDIYSNILSSRKETEFYNSSNKPHEWRKLFFALCIFHCIIRERRLFGPIGWNVNYEFNDSDLRISYKQLFLMVESFDQVPFEALKYLTANCNYGGRVTDDWDRRTLAKILSQSYASEVLEQSKVIPVAGYEIYQFESCEEIIEQIKKFPQVQSPEVFGLHPNAELSKSIRESYELCSRLLALQPQAVSISFDEQKNTILSMISFILSKIPRAFDIELVREKYPTSYNESLSTVILQELNRYNHLIETIIHTLLILKQAYEGVILITWEYEIIAESLLKNKIPDVWLRFSYNTCKNLASYIEDLHKRIAFFEDWINAGRPVVFWISGFFFTQSFLTGVLQEYARVHKIPIDTLSFSYEVLTSTPTTAPDFGSYISGLHLEGAGWDGDCLKESSPRELYSDFPVIWLKPTQSPIQASKYFYLCPVYKTLLRSGVLTSTGHSNNYIFAINLKTLVDEAHWVKRGVALFTQLDD